MHIINGDVNLDEFSIYSTIFGYDLEQVFALRGPVENLPQIGLMISSGK